MSDIQIRITGTSPMLCHNAQLVDKDNPFVQEIAAITAKKRKTEEDRRAIEKLEWYGGLYTGSDIAGPIMPTANIRKCLIQAAKITRRGKDVERALAFKEMNVPIVYEGSRDIDVLFKNPAFHNRASVKVGMSRVMRVRPQFPQWVLTAEAFLLDNVMDFDDLLRIVELAGIAEGLGDNRVNGYGRFIGEVVKK